MKELYSVRYIPFYLDPQLCHNLNRLIDLKLKFQPFYYFRPLVMVLLHKKMINYISVDMTLTHHTLRREHHLAKRRLEQREKRSACTARESHGEGNIVFDANTSNTSFLLIKEKYMDTLCAK